jgi:hypothetical protein
MISLARDWEVGHFIFAYLFFLLAFYPCIVYPHIGDLTNLAGYPPLNQISYFVITSLTTTYHWEWIINSRKIARRCQYWRIQESLQGKIFLVPTLFIASLLEDEQRLSMGEEVGTLQLLEFKRGAKKKFYEKNNEWEKERKKRKRRKKYEYV